MGYKFNIFTGTLDIAGTSGGGTGNVTGVPPTTITAIARWADTTGTTIENSLATIQDSGAIESQGFITNRNIFGTVTVNATESWIAPALTIEPGGNIIIYPGGELILI